jgi:hypothetical protein
MGEIKRLATSAFVLFHVLAITCWSVPLDSPLLTKCRNLVGPYMLWSGLFQRWDMFAPDPLKVNSYVEARVTFEDGHSVTWSFPRMDQLGFADRYFQERYRKYATEYLVANAGLWPDAARRIARLNNQGPSRPAVVILIRRWSEIKPPDKNGEFRAAPWQGAGFFVYVVTRDDLKIDIKKDPPG